MRHFFFKDTATTEIYTYLYTRSLHDALPILSREVHRPIEGGAGAVSSYAPLTLSFRCAEILGATSCKGIGDGDGCGGLRAGSADRPARGFLDVGRDRVGGIGAPCHGGRGRRPARRQESFPAARRDRKSGVWGKSVSLRVEL